MNVLDENVIDNQRRQLQSWRIAIHQIGHDVGRQGMKDQEIIPFLHQQKNPTFFTRDDDFYDRKLCHAGYCLVLMDVKKEEFAVFVRRFLRHPAFKIKAERMGRIVRVSHVGLSVWNLYAEKEERLDWNR